MRYKLKLSRTTEVMDIVDIPADHNLRIGDVILVDEKYHELKIIIRPVIAASESRNNNGFTVEEYNLAMPTLVIGDSFPLI